MEPVVVTRLTVAELVDLVVPRLAQQLLDALSDEAPSSRRGCRRKPSASRAAQSRREDRSVRRPETAP